MGGHHKKNLRAEKAKVKLKGAKLPKGLNVTKTDFKVRKIEIREQLKESVLNDSGQRQLNLKETLSRLKHHSSKFRTDALRSVRDAVKSGQADHLVGHLNELLQGIAAGALDMEHATRAESFKTLDVLMEALQPQAITPFFHILSTYLRCAMTHVQPAVQEDSLLMLDVLLQRVPPRLMAERSASTIIGNFIDMISRARHDQERSNRTLTLNLGQGKQTTIKWRTKVLQRLQQILTTLVQHDGPSSRSSAVRIEHFEQQQPQYYNVLSPVQWNTRSIYSILHEPKISAEGVQLQRYVEQLLPLMYDNWLEVRPQQQRQPLLNQDSATSLCVLLNILSQLWSLVLHHESLNHTKELSMWLREQYGSKFMNNFLPQQGLNFPYQQLPLAHKKSKKKDASDGGQFCTPQNINLVQLACLFQPQPGHSESKLFARLVEYMIDSLRRLQTLTPVEQLQLVNTLRLLVLDSGEALMILIPQQLRQMLSNAMEAYVQQRYTTREGVASKVLNLLCEMVQQPRVYASFGGAETFAMFLSYLPQLLLKPTVGEGTLRVMASLCRQLNGVFMCSLIKQAEQVLQNLEQLKVTGETDKEEDRFEQQKRVINLFYYARQMDEDKQLEKLKTLSQGKLLEYFQTVLTYA